MKRNIKRLIGAAGMMAALSAQADIETDIANAISQDPAAAKAAFDTLAPQLMRGFVHRNPSVAATLGGGVGGFSLSVDTVATELDKNAVKTLTGGAGDLDVSTLVAPRLSASFGLPMVPLNASVSYADLGDNLYSLFSAQVGYAIVEGGALSPAVNIFYSYSASTAVKVIDTTVHALGVKLSKGLGVGIKLVPFASATWVSAESRLKASNGTSTYRFRRTDDGLQLGAGASFQLGPIETAYQFDTLFGGTSHTLRLGVRF